MSQPDSPLPPLLRFSHEAMNTLFEISIAGEEPEYARQAAAEVFAEVDRLEGRLSRFVENSEISRINRLSGLDAVPVSEQTLECLRVAKVVSQATGGAFDATLGTLLALRPSESASRREPAPEELNAARDRTGMDLLELDETALTARLTVPGVQIDLGAIGKGYAIDQGVAILREWGIGAAMLDGGGSSLYALGAPEGRAGWPLGVGVGADEMDPDDRRILLRDLALSASGTAFLGEHILDPRTGRPPIGRALRAWALNPSATVADALSTAFMVLTPEEVAACCAGFTDVGAMLLVERESRRIALRFGSWPATSARPE